MPDFTILDSDSIVTLRPVTPAAIAWVEDNIHRDEESFQPWWPMVVIEPRYVRMVLAGIRVAGLSVEEN